MTKKTLLKQPAASLFVGGLIGTGAALLFAPKSGKETRRRINGFASDVKGRAQCYALRGRDRMADTVRKGTGYFAERKSLFSASVDAGRKAYREEKERLTKAH
jgi:gas vesicle protein